MIDNVEKKELGLKNMLRTVIKDKSKIEETIESLEQYKKEALQKTWEKVNAYEASNKIVYLCVVTLEISSQCCYQAVSLVWILQLASQFPMA